MATKNLGQVSAIHIGALEPQNKNLIWRDISQNPNLWKLWNSLGSVWEVVPSQAVVNNFINLGDTPISYQGSGGKILKVKANLSGIEFDDEVTFLSEINGAVNKAIIDDSDEFLLSDAGTVKKTLWSNIKSTIKAYFDTLYVSVSDVTSQLISNWNTAYGWGDHSAEGYLKTETDPVFLAHPASNVINSGSGDKYLSDDGGYKDLYHNDLLDRGDADSHPQTAITGLVAKLIELEKSNPVRYVRFFRAATEELFGETYYTSTEEEGSGPVLDISQAITGTDIATADQVAQFSGIPVPAGMEFTVRQLNVDILARKNATSRTVSLFAEFWNMDSSGVLTQLGTSNVLTLSENAESKPLFFSLSSEYTPEEGSRAVIIFRAFQTGTGGGASAIISIEDQTGSRWSFDTAIRADGGGHVFEDQSGTVLPTRNVAKAGAGIEFEDDEVEEKTVVRASKSLTDHIDGADEEKHTANQIHGGSADDNKIYYVDSTTKKLTPSNFTVDQILQLSSIDVTEPDWQIGEQRLVTVEKTIDEEPSLKGATQLVDLVLPPATVTTLEGATGWVGETRTLTGANFFGEIGRIGQRGTGSDGTIYICTAATAGTQGGTNGSATFVRNRSVDALAPDNNTNDSNIANLLDPTRVGGNADANWDVVNNVLIINTLVCRVGTWFTSGTGYFFMCYDRLGTNFYWRRLGQPQAIQRPINAANYPTLTSNLLAHDFTTGAYQNQSGDETNYQDQTFYDATTRRLFWQVKTGIWEEITINK